MMALYIPWFRIESWQLPLVDVAVEPFGILVAIGVLFGEWVAEQFGKRNGIEPRVVADMVAHVVIGAAFFCYFLNGLFYETDAFMEILRDPRKLFTTYLGLSSYGGFVGAVVGLVVWKWRRRKSAIVIGDAAAFAFPFGWLFGRTGCFLVHDHPGKVTDFFLAVADYQVGFPPYQPRHDLGLYEVFWCIGIIATFLYLARERRTSGFYIALLPISYAPVRFFLDFLRAGPADGGDVRYLGFTPGQYGSLLILIAGLALWAKIRRGGPTRDEVSPAT
ncbi:MAG: prolipoprotein diacylglyceryl transferase [Myxococcales bacterium]|nr:prolipoprotein diacylglyceryl transferase [Myxococcales bacterium]